MVKGGRLKAALDAEKGKDYHVERQKKLEKQARKRKRGRDAPVKGNGTGDGDSQQNGDEEAWSGIEGEEEKEHGRAKSEGIDADGDQSGESGSEEEGFGVHAGGIDISHIDDTDSDSELEDDVEDEEDVPAFISNGYMSEDDDQDEDDPEEEEDHDEDEEEDEDIPLSELSDLSSTAKEDIIPHQRLTINNTAALQKALRSIALPTKSMVFSEHQSLTSEEPISIPDVNDDLNRELAFYKQSLDAVKQARALLKAEGVPFSRPPDYFAEMVKSDDHMGRIKKKLVDEAARKKAAAEARKQRDLRKFGKQVQVAKLQERDRAKRETLDKIQMLKKKRKNAPTTDGVYENENGDDDMFDVSLEDSSNKRHTHQNRLPTSSSAADKRGGTNFKRQKRDQKFGFGGKKRFSKSGDAISSGDLSGFNSGRERGRGGAGGGAGKGPPGAARGKQQKRLGKSRRVKTR